MQKIRSLLRNNSGFLVLLLLIFYYSRPFKSNTIHAQTFLGINELRGAVIMDAPTAKIENIYLKLSEDIGCFGIEKVKITFKKLGELIEKKEKRMIVVQINKLQNDIMRYMIEKDVKH